MISKKRLVYYTALLTSSSLLMSCIGIAFQVWLVGRIGSAGIGLFQLVSSVTNLCATFAISGIRFATTRLVGRSWETITAPVSAQQWAAVSDTELFSVLRLPPCCGCWRSPSASSG